MEEEQKKWLKIVIIVSILLLIGSGFTFGYLYGDKSCIENPLLCGVKKLDNDYKSNFTCSCYSSKGVDTITIKWNANGLIKPDEFIYKSPQNP